MHTVPIPIPSGVTASYMVFDRDTGTLTSSYNEHERIRSASLVKLMIALDYFDNHGAPDAIPAPDLHLLESMLRSSDDNAASALWARDGYWGEIVERIVAEVGLSDTRPPVDPTHWGYTPTSAADIVAVYRYIFDSALPSVCDFIMSNLHQATSCACDGFDQSFGIPRVIPGAAYKQGWSPFKDPQNPCRQPQRPRADIGAAKDGPLDHAQARAIDVDLTRPAMHTTGTYDNDRRIAALLTLQADGIQWDESADNVTQLFSEVHKNAGSHHAAD